MTVGTLNIGGQKFRVVREDEFQSMRREAKAKSCRKRPAASAKKTPPVEMYTDERVAEFILGNTVDPADYARACKLVRKMGLDPANIDHDKPVGVK